MNEHSTVHPSAITRAADPPTFVHTAGLLCLAGAVIGVAGGLVTAFIAPSVGIDRYSYPYGPTGYVIAEVSFALNHVLLLIGILAVARSGATGSGRLGRVGVRISIAAMALLTLCELVSIGLLNSPYQSSRADALGAGYGVATIGIGVGLILTGIAVVKTRTWTGWARFIVLACGIAVFVIVLPGLFGPFLAARMALTVWMLMFAALGLALLQTHQRTNS